MWRYTSISDLINIIKASSMGTLIAIAVFALIHGFTGFPKTVLFIDFTLCTILLCLSRASVRLYFSNLNRSEKTSFSVMSSKIRKKIVIIGAGNSTEKIIREIRDNSGMNYIVVGIVDDDKLKIGATIHGVPILGKINDLTSIEISFDEIDQHNQQLLSTSQIVM